MPGRSSIVELVLSELVANSLRHASPLPDGTIRVHWKSKNDVVELEVSDGGGQTTPSVRRPAPWAPSGRGLRIVRSLAHEWGVLEDRGTVTVWVAVGGPSRRQLTGHPTVESSLSPPAGGPLALRVVLGVAGVALVTVAGSTSGSRCRPPR